jgi:hypothetical protein
MVNVDQKRHAIRRVMELAKIHGVTVAKVDHVFAILTLEHQDLECRVNAIRGSDGYCRTRWAPKKETTETLKRWQVHADTRLFGSGQVKPMATTELLLRGLRAQLEWLQERPFVLQ